MPVETENAAKARRGLVAILAATVIAGAAGYVLQALVPLWLSTPAEYLQFGVFWATTFLLVSMVSGFQQEVTRAIRPVEDADVSQSAGSATTRTLGRTTLVVILGAILVALLITVIASDRLFPISPAMLGLALAIGLSGYVGISVLSGIFYGLESYGLAATTTVLDSVLRFFAVLIPVSLGLGLVPAAFGIVLPFVGTAVVMWLVARKRLTGRYRIDVETKRLLLNGAQAMLAALATGVLISGLPSILKLTSSSLGETSLAGIVLALTLTRAPIVVPLLALQSYLVVTYRRLGERAWIRAIALFGAVAVLTVILSLAAWAVGPWFLETIYGADFVLTGVELALILASGGATGGLCVVAPALLARSLHGRYLVCWLASALTTVIALLVADGSVIATILAIAVGPLVGCVLSLALLKSNRTATASE